MRYLVISITILLILTGCTMHPPSTAAFMDITEKGRQNNDGKEGIAAKVEYAQYKVKDDGWDIPVSVDLLRSQDGITWGAGLLPSPYMTIGIGSKYYGARAWISAPWVIGVLGVLCPTCLVEDDGEEYEDKNDRYKVDEISDLGDLPALWLVSFAGGISIIEQFPIGKSLRIGVEEFITRNVYIPVRDNDEFSNIEAGFNTYVTLTFDTFSMALEARHSFINCDPDRSRWSLGLTFNYIFDSSESTPRDRFLDGF